LEVVPFTSSATDHDKVDALERGGATEVAFDISSEDEVRTRQALERVTAFVAERRCN